MSRFLVISLLTGACATGLAMVGCDRSGYVGLDGAFVGPPQGSASGNTGLDPLIGATPFTFAPEIRNITGFTVDHWFMDPGRDSDDGPNLQLPIADGINTLSQAGFDAFVGSGAQATPSIVEINFQYPLSVSFMCQWYRRLADNSRPREFDIFGREVYSSSALDISFITAPVTEQRDQSGLLISKVIQRQIWPNREDFLPLANWTSPPAGEIGAFPSPRQPFSSNQFSECAIVRPNQLAGQLFGGLGVSLPDDDENSHVENMGTVPDVDTQGTFRPIGQPLGLFGDNFATEYRFAPVRQPKRPDPQAIPPVPPQSLSDPDLEAALIEYSRHMAAVKANLVAQGVGVQGNKDGTIMDNSKAVWENRYEYRFEQDDFDDLANKLLPGRFRD